MSQRPAVCQCGGHLEASWEHESRYTMVCRSCMTWYAFATGWLMGPDDPRVNMVVNQGPFTPGSHLDPEWINRMHPDEKTKENKDEY